MKLNYKSMLNIEIIKKKVTYTSKAVNLKIKNWAKLEFF